MAIRKISLSFSEGLYAALSQWADNEGTKPTSLATDLLSGLIREEIKQGRLTYDDPQKEGEDSKDSDRAIAFIQALAGRKNIDLIELQRLADDINVPSDRLAQILSSQKGANGSHAKKS